MQESFEKGFTLIELIAIVLLVSIIGVVAFGRLGGVDDIEDKAFFDDTVNAVRYAQKLAVSTGCDVQVNLSASGYDLHQRQTGCTSGGYTRDVLNPANRGNPYQNSNPDITINPVATFIFTAQSNVSGLSGDQSFDINGRQFTVFQNTGLVDVP